jgi:hypothetical protein
MAANTFDNRRSFERPFRRRRTIQFARDKYLVRGLFVPESRRALLLGNDSRERHHGYAKFILREITMNLSSALG